MTLYIKSRDIIAATKLSNITEVVVRLGGFHMILSFLGCIGYIMAGSGIKEALSTIYAEKTVDTILSGHAYARAVRAHTLLQVALYKLIFKELEENDLEFQQLREDVSLASILCNLSIENINIHQLQTNDKFQKLMIIIENKLSELENRNKTAKLWIN